MPQACLSGGTETWPHFNLNALHCGQKLREILSVRNKVTLTLVLVDMNAQKQHSETHYLSVEKKDESDYQQVTWVIRLSSLLIEILYRSREAFLLDFSQSSTGDQPVRAKLHPLPVISTSKIIHHGLFFAFLFPALTLFSKAASAYFNSACHFSSLPSGGRKFSQLPAAVSLHCRRQRGLARPSLNALLQREFVSS